MIFSIKLSQKFFQLFSIVFSPLSRNISLVSQILNLLLGLCVVEDLQWLIYAYILVIWWKVVSLALIPHLLNSTLIPSKPKKTYLWSYRNLPIKYGRSVAHLENGLKHFQNQIWNCIYLYSSNMVICWSCFCWSYLILLYFYTMLVENFLLSACG